MLESQGRLGNLIQIIIRRIEDQFIFFRYIIHFSLELCFICFKYTTYNYYRIFEYKKNEKLIKYIAILLRLIIQVYYVIYCKIKV